MNRREFLELVGGISALGTLGRVEGVFASVPGERRLRLGVVSDIHINIGYKISKPNAAELIAHAGDDFEKVLRWYDEMKVDAVVIPGDLADLGRRDELKLVRTTWEKVFPNDTAADGRRVERLFVTGNHECIAQDWKDLGGYWDAKARDQVWFEAFGEHYENIRVKTVKGYDFILCGWGHSNESVGAAKFARLAAECAERAKGKSFFQVQHEAPARTCHGGFVEGHDNGVSTKVMAQYPNCVSFSGHTHAVLIDERAVWQREFTSVGCGSLNNSFPVHEDYPPFGFENGPVPGISGHLKSERRYYESGAVAKAVNGAKVMYNYEGMNLGLCKEALLVDVYDDHLDFVRRDFNWGEALGEDWRVPFPAKAGGPFDPSKRPGFLPKCEFAEGTSLALSAANGRTRSGLKCDVLKLVVPGGMKTTGLPLFAWEVGFEDAKGVFNHLEFCMNPDQNVPKAHHRDGVTLVVRRDRVPEGVTLVVKPLDCFCRRGNALKTAFERR